MDKVLHRADVVAHSVHAHLRVGVLELVGEPPRYRRRAFHLQAHKLERGALKLLLGREAT